MNTAATPAQAKAFLARVKDEIAVLADGAPEEGVAAMSRRLETLFFTLLRLEMLQRGVVVEQQVDTDTNSAAQILAAVQSVAGKAVLTAREATTLPKPLLAASCGLQGKVAETMRSCLLASGTTTAADLAQDMKQRSLQRERVAAVVKRCQDLHDHRFLALLKLWDDAHDLAIHLLTIAEGSYYRAASFQPEAPLLWKRAWETHGERARLQQADDPPPQYESWGSIPALDALRRIIQSKGNTKRAAELAIRLAGAWLDAARLTSQPPSSAPETLTVQIEKTFVEAYRSISAETLEAKKCVTRARGCLADVSSSEALSPEDDLVRTILTLEVAHMHRQVNVDYMCKEMQQQAKNRSSKSPSGQLEEKAREKVYLSMLEDTKSLHSLDDVAHGLLQLTFANQVASPSRLAAFSTLCQFLVDQREFVLALQKSGQPEQSVIQEAWLRLGQFVTSCLRMYTSLSSREEVQQHLQSSSSLAEKDFLQEISHLVCQIAWMTFSSHVTKNMNLPFSEADFGFVHYVAAELSQEKGKQVEKSKASAVSSSSSSDERQYQRLRAAAFAAKCWMLFHQESLVSSTILQVTTELLSLSTPSLVEVDADHGAIFLGTLLTWSGFFRSAWEFCILPEARALTRKAKLILRQAESLYGRPTQPIENCLLELIEADAEVTGLKEKARQTYEEVFASSLEDQQTESFALVRARCCVGFARLGSDEGESETLDSQSMDWPMESLKILESLDSGERSLYLWKSTGAAPLAIRSQIALSRQLTAESLINSGHFHKAGEFLYDAVRDAPTDQLAAFALGAFLLRMVFFHGEVSPESQKVAQTQLLKAAKLDAAKPDPFSLLGYWYESKNDMKRAAGCYSKALALDPSHPVAGRGMLRLAEPGTLHKILQTAITSTSSLNGWAWLSVGETKSKIDGEDELAVSALLKATRARDVYKPASDPLSIFFSGPSLPEISSHKDLVRGLLELSACYRRLGRCSAEVRTLHTALDVAGENAPWNLLHTCAQAEMEMGLVEDAKERFVAAASRSSGAQSRASKFGEGLATFTIGQRELQDGKAGAALKHTLEAIAACEFLADQSCSASKFVADMHTALAAFPAKLFVSDESISGPDSEALKAHVALVAKGEVLYASAVERVPPSDDGEDRLSRASLVFDGAVNLLLQAQLKARWRGYSGQECASDCLLLSDFQRAEGRFREALDLEPLHSPAWCGLGCSLVADPIKAQHAFSRAIQLDLVSADSYADLGFLYLEQDALLKSAEVCDVLTQLADTPVTWLNRAYRLEDEVSNQEEKEEHVSDAYRAALQVRKDPYALLGLAASYRAAAAVVETDAHIEWENHVLLEEYESITSIAPSTESVISPDRVKDLPGDPYLNSPSSVALKQQIIRNPDRGDLWLALGEEILSTTTEENSERHMNAAKAAVQRASMLFLDRLSTPCKGEKGFVSSSNLSSSLALENWLATDEAPADTRKAQLALLICPQNVLARNLLLDGHCPSV